jgi:hypothetical protein
MDACLFIRRTKAGVVFLLLYVDDVLLASSSQTARASVIEQLKRDFKITHKEKPDTYVGIRIEQDKDGIRISQEAYVNEILKRYGMEESKGMRTPWVQRPVKRQDKDKPLEPRVMEEIIGSLTYRAGATRPDISAAVHAFGSASE